MPVYKRLDTDYEKIGARIKSLRKQRDLTLYELASRVLVSAATLSAVENQKATPDVTLLVALSQALETPVGKLLPESTSQHFEITRRLQTEADPPLHMKLISRGTHSVRSYHTRLWPLAGNFVGRYLEPFAVKIEPVSDEQQFSSHHHEEFFFVISGEVECLVKSPDGLVREVLQPGDCMYFWSYLPHCIRSVGESSASSIHVFSSLNEPADSEASDGNGAPIVYLMEAPERDIVEHTASRIAFLRHARGMSAADFAERLGISVRRLASIERGERPIRVDLLLKICRQFRKPTEYFLGTGVVDRPFVHVMRADQIRRLARRTDAHQTRPGCACEGSCRPLADGFSNRGMDPYYIKLTPRRDRSEELVSHAGQEFVYVVRGSVSFTTERGERTYAETLYPGDSCLIDASVPHRFLGARPNPYDKPGAEMILVGWTPSSPSNDDAIPSTNGNHT